MKKRVFIIHGWDGYPEEGWFPWLKRELTKRGFAVKVPRMPNAAEPKIQTWISFLRRLVGKPDEHIYFIGHSIGCQAILRYLEKLPPRAKIGGAVFVAGWFTLKNLETDEEKTVARPWLETPINSKKVKSRTKNLVAIFSDNDYFVPKKDRKSYRRKLGAKIIIQHNKGHFSGNDGIRKAPIVLESLLKISKN